ncbi:MAG: hypothetical protein ACOYNI_05010 [Acidimicrobiia bacterium]
MDDTSAATTTDQARFDALLERLLRVGWDRDADRATRRSFAVFGPIGVSVGAFVAATPLAPVLIPLAGAVAVGGPAIALFMSGGMVSSWRARRARNRALDTAFAANPPKIDRALALYEHGRALDAPRDQAAVEASAERRIKEAIDAMYANADGNPMLLLDQLPQRLADQVHEQIAADIPKLALEFSPKIAETLGSTDNPVEFADAQLDLLVAPRTVYMAIAVLSSAIEQSPEVAARVIYESERVHAEISAYPRAAAAFAELAGAAHTRISEELAADGNTYSAHHHEQAAAQWASRSGRTAESRFLGDL